MPFAALKGYDEAVDDKKKLYTKRIELTEERKEELDRQICLFKISKKEQKQLKTMKKWKNKNGLVDILIQKRLNQQKMESILI